MNCQKFENVVGELARGQMMAAEQRGEALAHSDVCESCAMRLRDEEMLTRGLRSLGGEMESLSAPPELEAKLLEAFRVRPVVVPISKRSSSSRYWLAAVAAVLLIVMSVVALRFRASQTESPREIAASGSQQQQQQPEDKKSPDGAVKDEEKEFQTVKLEAPPIRRSPRRPSSQRSPRPQVANHVAQEIATDFIPLSYMNAANFQDGGQIVRVQLPRSALASFGLPVNMDRYNEKVKADVLFGVDGLAHAIRFVQ